MTEPLMVIAAVLALSLLVYLLGRTARMQSKERVRCPIMNTYFDVEFVRALDATWGPGRKLDVTRCSAFGGDMPVVCAKACLGDPRRKDEAREEPAPGAAVGPPAPPLI